MTWEEKNKLAYQKIQEANNILLVTHKRPDGDALSSSCIISLLLQKMNKKHLAFCPDPPGSIFSFLPSIEKIDSDPEITKSTPENKNNPKNFYNFDLVIVLDCGSITRTNLIKQLENKQPYQTILEFDHHPNEEGYSDLEIRNPNAAATTETLYHFFRINQLKIDKDVATCILTGILTDTSNFLNTGTTKESIDISSKMVSYGARFPKITKKTWQNKSLTSMKLLGVALNNLKINPKYKIAFTVLTKKEIDTYIKNEEIFDSITGFLGNINGVKTLLFLREEKKGNIKGSLRTYIPGLDISKLANYLNGGGHPQASGFMIHGNIVKEGNSWKIK